MKKSITAIVLCISLILSTFAFSFSSFALEEGTAYYIDSVGGDDSYSGTSPSKAWKTTANIESLSLNAGDEILFRKGSTYDCTVTLTCEGTKENPIVISSYGDGEKPRLTTNERNAVMKLFDCSYVTVSGFEITAHNGGGIWVDTYNRESVGVTIEDCVFHDMQNHTVLTRDNYSEGPISGRAAITVRRYGASPYSVNDFTAQNLEIYDCGNGIFFTGQQNSNKNSLVKNCYIHDLDGEAVVLEGCDGALVTHCRMIDCCLGEGVDENGEVLYYIAAAWFHYSINCTFEYCEIAGQKNIGDGMTVDFDHYSFNCTYQYIYSHDNMRFMVNNGKDDGNRGNTVRYCLSVNDYAPNVKNQIGASAGEFEFSFYNNTIVGCGNIVFDDLFDSVVANNIFIPAEGAYLSSDVKEFKTSGTIFTNNCYYDIANPLIDIKSMNINPGFSDSDLSDTMSFTLSKDSPLIGKGIEIDDGLTTDFFGNEITSNNIGCYGGSGTSAVYHFEGLVCRISRFFKTLAKTAVIIVKYGINRLIGKIEKNISGK